MDNRNDIIFDMKAMLKRFNIDAERWVGKTFKEKLDYLKGKLRSANKLELAECGSRLMDALLYTLRNSTKNETAQSYISLAETAFNLFRINFVVKNTFVAEQYEYHGRFDDLAHELGVDSDCEIIMSDIHTSGDMCKFLLTLSNEAQERFDICVTRIKDLNGPSGDDDDDVFKLKSVVVFTHGGNEYALLLESLSYDESGSDGEAELGDMYASVRLAARIDSYDEDAIDDTIHTLYSAYIGNVDLSKYMFEMDGMFFNKFKRVTTAFDVHNLDVDHMRLAIDRTLSHSRSRGFLIEGEPGVGKTVSVEKVLDGLTQYPVFWVPLDAISQASIEQTFNTLSRIDNSIIVFDDIDGLDMGKKDAYSTDFIGYLDNLRHESAGHVIIIIVNEPQKLHNMFRMRPGRIDEVIVVSAPRNAGEVFDVISQRFTAAHLSMPEWASLDNVEFRGICEGLVDKGITQAYITGIVSDLLMFYDDDCSFDNFRITVEKAMRSRENSMLVAGADGRLCTAQTVHPTTPPGPDGK